MPVPGIDPLSTYASLSGAGTDSLVSLLQKPNSGVPAALVLSELMRRQRIGREGYNESDLAGQTYSSQLRNPSNYMASGGAVGLPYSFADPQVLQAYGQSAGDYPAPQRSSASSSSRKGMRRGGQVKFGPGGAVGSGGITQLDQSNPLGLSASDSQSLSDVALLNMLGGDFGGQGSGQTVQGPFGTLNYGSAASLPDMSGLLSGNGQQATISGRWGQDHVPPPEPSYAQGPSAPNSPAATQRGAAVPSPVNPRGPMAAGGVSALPAAPASGPPGTIGGAVPVAPGQGGITNSPDQGGIMGTDFNPNNFLINTGLAMAASKNPRFTQALGESAQSAYQGEMARRMAIYGMQRDTALKELDVAKDVKVAQIGAQKPGDVQKLLGAIDDDKTGQLRNLMHDYFTRQNFREAPGTIASRMFDAWSNGRAQMDPTFQPNGPEGQAMWGTFLNWAEGAEQSVGGQGGVPSVAPTARPYTDFTQ